jgi:signal transduction histidine kinase
MRLRTKYALVLLLVVAVLGGVVLGSTELFKRQAVDQEEADLNRTAELMAAQVDENVHELRDEVGLYAARVEVANYSRSRETLHRFVSNSAFNQAQLIDGNGTVVDLRGNVPPAQRESIVGLDVSDQEFLRRASQAFLHVSRPAPWTGNQLPGNSSRYEVTFSAPVYYQDNESVKGVMRATVRIWETDILDPLEVTSPDRTLASLYATANTSERVVLNEETASFEEPLTANATLERTGWDLVLSRNRARLTQRLQSLQLIQGGSLLAVLVSIVGLGIWQYRTNLRQTDRLLEGFRALEAGQFDSRLRMRAAEEWEQIGNGFNDLARGLREREAAIQEREQRLSVLNRVLRHNLQNDLTVVQGYAEMLTEFGRDELETAQDEILSKVEGLIAHGQKARRIETALESAEEGTVDVDVVPVLADLLDDYGDEYDDVEVRRDLPEHAYVTAISSLQFGIESVVENAFEHNTSEDPVVEASVERDGDAVAVRIADDGPGIPEHEYQVLDQDEETALEHGSGIGMWLAYWVVEKSDGDLNFDQGDGAGVTVTMTFRAGEVPEDAGEETDLLAF